MSMHVSLEDAPSVSLNTLADFYLKCKEAYYNTGTPLIDDATFDQLESILRHRSPHHKALRVTGATKRSQDKITLPYWMGSQNKVYPGDNTAFQTWRKKVGEDTAIATAKLDGLSAIVVITTNTAHLYSRGDGMHAKDWTHHLEHMTHMQSCIRNIQSLLKKHTHVSRVVLRGEAIMSHKHFNVCKTKEKWTSTARNVVSGLLNAKQSSPHLLKRIDIVFYEVIEPQLPLFGEQLDWLERMSCKNVAYSLGKASNKSILSSDFTLKDLEPLFWAYREHCPYATDGVVVQCNIPHQRNTKNNPNYAFAFKIRVNNASQVAETKVVDVEWNMSRHGRLKPTVVLQPVTISNVTIERTTGFHYKFIHDNGVGKGAVVQIRRCGDVIPNIVAVKKPVKPCLPDVPFTLTKTGVDAFAVNIESSKDYLVRIIAHFFKVLDVPRMSGKTVHRFVNNGYCTALEIMNVSAKTMQEWEGFAQKSSVQLVKNMHACAQQASALQWIHAGSVFGEGIGERHIRFLLQHAPTLFSLQSLTKTSAAELQSHLLSLPGYQSTTVEQLLQHHDEFVLYWKQVCSFLKKRHIPTPSLQPVLNESQQKDLVGKTYCFTGVRDKELQKNIEQRGGKVVSAMSKNVNVLICDDVHGSSDKLKKAKVLIEDDIGITIVEYEKNMVV